MRDYEEENINQTEIIAMQCVGGEIEINTELLSIGLNIDNDNDPLPRFCVLRAIMEVKS